MIKVGQINHLEVVKKADFGVFLDAGDFGTSLLPNRFVPEESCVMLTSAFVSKEQNRKALSS